MKVLLPLVALGFATAAAPMPTAPMSPDEYVMTCGASDLYEQTSSQVVLETTANPQVRSFAQMMLTAHADTTNRVTAAARRAGVAVSPPMLTPLQAEMVAELRAESGAARDMAYIAQQKVAHNGALFVQQAYVAGGTSAPLRQAAGTVVPVVRQHIAMLMRM